MIEMLLQMTISEWMFFAASVIMLIGSLGLFRFPDVYTRAHATSIITIGGVCLTLFITAVASFFAGFSITFMVEILLIILFILITSPVTSHAVADSAYKMKIKPKKLFKNDMERR
ncbi:MAG: monovalent cation/H(+) antiporter subunit G [Nanoarchaeota archaeon]